MVKFPQYVSVELCLVCDHHARGRRRCSVSTLYVPATLRCGSTYLWKLGLTKANHCLMQPSMSLPRSRTSRSTWLQLQSAMIIGWGSSGHTSSRQAEITIRFGEYSHIQQVQHPLVVKRENAFQDQYMRGVYGRGFIQTCVLFERVDRNIRFLTDERLAKGRA